jgi:hypothetical protein
MSQTPSPVTDPVFSQHSAIIGHGFFTRKGGVSDGIYRSLNCGLGTQDDPTSVAENRARANRAINPNAKLVTLYQIHSNQVLTITDSAAIPAWTDAKMDAIVTNVPDLTIGILTADCAPILFFDPIHRVIGAAHAGWRGAIDNVAENTVRAMEQLGAARANIYACIGPCISAASYEVGGEFYDHFTHRDSLNAVYFSPSKKPGHHQFDLQGFLLTKLMRMNLAYIQNLALDTCAGEDLFFSYRRTTLNGGGDYARQLSAIALKS